MNLKACHWCLSSHFIFLMPDGNLSVWGTTEPLVLGTADNKRDVCCSQDGVQQLADLPILTFPFCSPEARQKFRGLLPATCTTSFLLLRMSSMLGGEIRKVNSGLEIFLGGLSHAEFRFRILKKKSKQFVVELTFPLLFSRTGLLHVG
jgi:hypothetical protein